MTKKKIFFLNIIKKKNFNSTLQIENDNFSHIIYFFFIIQLIKNYKIKR